MVQMDIFMQHECSVIRRTLVPEVWYDQLNQEIIILLISCHQKPKGGILNNNAKLEFDVPGCVTIGCHKSECFWLYSAADRAFRQNTPPEQGAHNQGESSQNDIRYAVRCRNFRK